MGAERLGRYTILKHLASGGMADVLLARTEGIEGFERHVVVKRIRAEHAKDERFIQMFLDEARLAAGLHHQNIVQVNDIGEANGDYFFAMEYLHGEDLRKILSAVSKSKMHMPLGYVVAIVASVASGLHHAHERHASDGTALDIVHRDVSPSNVLVGYDGAVKIVDFGIAKAAMRQVETKSGSLKGKVSYMSPEQCKGDSIDRRSDVYALGVVLYELATTTRLFKGDNEYLLMDSIVNGKIPPPKSRRGDLPTELAMIIMRAVATEPEKRYQSSEELRIALEQFAIKAGLTASTSALATYMHKLFGAKPEPWLESKDSTAVDTRPMGDGSGSKPGSHSGQVHHSWTEIPRDGILAAAEAEAQEAKTTTDGKRRLSRPVPVVTPAAFEDTNVPQISARETRTSNKFGFEAQEKGSNASGMRPPAPSSNAFAKAVMIGLPMIAIAGVATWHFALRDNGTATSTTTTAPAPQAAAMVAPPPVAAPAAAAKVEVALDADVANARVVFRRRVSPAPFKTELSPSDIVELVEVSAPGFKTERYWLTFDRETHLKAHMVKGSGVEEPTEEQTLVALGEAAAETAPAAPEAKPAATAVAVAKPAAPAATPRRKVGAHAAEEAPAVEQMNKPAAPIEQAAATVQAPLPTPVPAPEPPPVAVKAAPVPAVAKPIAEPARAVPPATFKTLLASSTPIGVPDVVQTQMAREEKKKAAAVIKVCIDPAGNVTTTAVIKSSGYAEYDQNLVSGIRGWKYKAYVDGGKAVPACSAVAVSYSR